MMAETDSDVIVSSVTALFMLTKTSTQVNAAVRMMALTGTPKREDTRPIQRENGRPPSRLFKCQQKRVDAKSTLTQKQRLDAMLPPWC